MTTHRATTPHPPPVVHPQRTGGLGLPRGVWVDRPQPTQLAVFPFPFRGRHPAAPVERRRRNHRLSVARSPHQTVVAHDCTGNGGQRQSRAMFCRACQPPTRSTCSDTGGYGLRAGSPSKDAMNAAALAAYRALRREFPATPVCVLGESIGSGPASSVGLRLHPTGRNHSRRPLRHARQRRRPPHAVSPRRLMLRDNWDNIAALSPTPAPSKSTARSTTAIIPFEHAKNLAAHSRPRSSSPSNAGTMTGRPRRGSTRTIAAC